VPDVGARLSRWLLRWLARTPDEGLERHGTAYGGWTIPCGLLEAGSIVYSGGVGEDTSFDLGVIETYGCTVWAFDPTPRAVEHAAGLDEPRLEFLPFGLWSEDSIQQFHAPPFAEWVSHSITNQHATAPSFDAECRSVPSLMAELGHEHLDLLKLDVEGAEYEVLRVVRDGSCRPRAICVELHRAGPLRRAREVWALVRAGYSLVAAEGWDLTFARRRRDDGSGGRA
jgi:FkbM family methyltransferase